MFADIAERYDLANTILTGGTDFLWRNLTAVELVRLLRRRIREGTLASSPLLLDACAGSVKLGKRILHHLKGRGRLIGTDFCLPLLKQGKQNDGPDIYRVTGDVLKLPLKSGVVDAISVGFGYRNLENRRQGLTEFHRVLRVHGLLAILEFHVPPPSLFRRLYLLYFDHCLPTLGNLISGTDTAAYEYLNESVRAFPEPDKLKEEFSSSGFEVVRHRPMMMGAVHLYLLSADESETSPASPN